MTSLVTTVLSHADSLPIVGGPISAAKAWIPGYQQSCSSSPPPPGDRSAMLDSDMYAQRFYGMPPPPYEKVVPGSTRLAKLSDYIWKHASPLASSHANSTAASSSETIDRKQVEHAVTLITMASDLDQVGNRPMAVDLYMMGLDRMLAALPSLESNPKLKYILEHKLIEFKLRNALNLDRPLYGQERQGDEADATESTSLLSSLVTHAVVLGTVLVKKSPMPNVVYSTLSYAKAGLSAVDNTCQIRKRTWNIAVHGIAKAVEIDRQYAIQSRMAEATSLLVTLLKAGIESAEAH